MQVVREVNTVLCPRFTSLYGETHTAVIEEKLVRFVSMQICLLCVLMGARVDN